jgi:hypothetical protein
MIAYEKCTPTETSELARHRRLCRKRLNPQTEYISKLAAVLNVSVDYLLGHENGGKQKGGPVGKARRVFEEVSELPRHQQQRILGIVEDLIAARGTTR